MDFWNWIAPPLMPNGLRIHEFIENGQMVFALPWPHFGAWTKNREGNWNPADISLSTVTPADNKLSPQLAFFGYCSDKDDRQRTALEISQWANSVPEPVRDIAQQFEGKAVRIVHFVCTFGRDAQDMLISGGHSLVFGLMLKAGKGSLAHHEIRRLLRCKRREVAGALGFPSTKSCVKLLAAVSPATLVAEQRGPAAAVTGYEMLAGIAINAEAREIAAHLPRLTTDLIRILAFPPLLQRVTPSLLQELADFEQPFDPAQELADLVRLELLLNVPNPRGPFHSVRALHEEHNRLAALHRRVLQGHDRSRLIEPFSQPPLPGNTDIIPITTPMDLLKEGDECHNCVGSYIDSVRCGDCYIYRVLKPGRATLSIVRSGGNWVISELKAPCNRYPSARTRTAVNNWLGLSKSKLADGSYVSFYNFETATRRPRMTAEDADRWIQQVLKQANTRRHYDYRYDRR